MSSRIERKGIKTNKEVDAFLDEMRSQWSTDAIQKAIVADQGKAKEQRLIYDKEWVKAALEEFRVAQAKIEKCTKNLIINKKEIWYLADRAPVTKKAMKALYPNIDENTVVEYGDAIIKIIKQGFKKA